MAANKNWNGTTYGSSFMHRWLIWLLKKVDTRIIYFIVYIFILPFLLFKPGFWHIYRYLHQRIGKSSLSSLRYAYRNHFLFAQAVIDKFAMYAGREFDIELEGEENFAHLAQLPDGFVQLSSHVGNYEIAGYSLKADKKRFNALVYFGEKEEVMHNREKLFTNSNIRMIPLKADLSHLFLINSALAEGETVSIPADRIWGSKRCIEMEFLGKIAKFPLGPFQTITTREVEALVVHVVKTSFKKYRIIVTPLPYDHNASKREQVELLAKGYIAELEKVVKKYPCQWFNFFDFWQQ